MPCSTRESSCAERITDPRPPDKIIKLTRDRATERAPIPPLLLLLMMMMIMMMMRVVMIIMEIMVMGKKETAIL